MARGLRGLDAKAVAVPVALLLGPLGLTLLLRAFPVLDLTFESPRFHIVVVSGIAFCALLIAVLTSVVAARSKQAAPVLLAVGCICVGLLMSAHGITTPGIGHRPLNMWVARLPVLGIAGFALCLALAAASPDHPSLKRFVGRAPHLVLGAVAGILAVGSLLVVANPASLAGSQPVSGERALTLALLGTSSVALLTTGAFHWRRWRLGRDRVQLGLVAASWLSLNAAVSFEIGHLWQVSWWDYHIFLLAGFAAAAFSVVTESRRAHSAHQALATLSISDPLEHIARGYPEALRALVAAVEAKDLYTHGHSTHVADLTVRIGLRLDLGPDELRGLAQGAYLHDIGKIGVPDQVLNKPGRLTDEEWAWIEAHPVIGQEMAGRAPSLHESLPAIRHHHERWDGSGYPDHLTGAGIPIAARIASVADVWDALTSDRAYRNAWAPDRALAHLAAGAGRLFDPQVVEAFLDLVAEQTLWPERTDLDLEALSMAAEACHPRRPHQAEHRLGSRRVS